MIQVSAENYSQENFLGIGKKNKAKRQEKKAVRKEKKAVKKEARKGKGLIGKIANRIGVGKQAKAIRKDVKTAKSQIKTTGSFNRGTVRNGTIRINPSPSKFGGSKNGKPIIKNPNPFNAGGGIKPVSVAPARGTTPVQREVSTINPQGNPPQENTSQGGYEQQTKNEFIEQGGSNSTQNQSMDREMSSQTQNQNQSNEAVGAGSEQSQNQPNEVVGAGGEQIEKNPDGTPKEKPFNWKLWGGVGGGVVLLIVIGVIIYFTTKK